ncbi:MAG: hypothetical protein ACRYF3_14795 [Janthinobacterium lividum]
MNATWPELALTGIDLIAWPPTTLLEGDLATCEPKALRYRLLHTAARIVRTGHRVLVKLADRGPWAEQSAAAFERLALIPAPLRTLTSTRERPPDRRPAVEAPDATPAPSATPPSTRPTVRDVLVISQFVIIVKTGPSAKRRPQVGHRAVSRLTR